MISSSELRIGNWIFTQFEESEEVLVVTADIIKELSAYEENPNDEQWSRGAPCNYYSKITLTEEWLLKFGFEWYDEEETNYDWGYKMGEFKVSQMDFGAGDIKDREYRFEPMDIHIRHVHQLQNLFFSLTGKELVASI